MDILNNGPEYEITAEEKQKALCVRKKETSETKDRIECMSRLQREEGFLREGIERCGGYTSAT
jgi:hypothetical protein